MPHQRRPDVRALGEFEPVFGEDIPEAGETAENLADRRRIRRQQTQQASLRRKALEEQRGVQKTRLSELAEFLAAEEQRKFTQTIPEIAETAQAGGFLETSGFGGALARERTRLAGTTAARLGEQAISDRELEIRGIGNIAEGTIDLGTAGLEREFSVDDLTRSENLARELGRLGIARPQQTSRGGGSNLFQGALGGAGIGAQVGGVPGAFIGGAVGAVGGAASDSTYLCTKMKNLGILSQEEVNQIHDKVMPTMFTHPISWLTYKIVAPLFIKYNPNINWSKLRPLLYDNVMDSKTNEEAFQKYRSVCIDLFSGKLNLAHLEV